MLKYKNYTALLATPPTLAFEVIFTVPSRDIQMTASLMPSNVPFMKTEVNANKKVDQKTQQ